LVKVKDEEEMAEAVAVILRTRDELVDG